MEITDSVISRWDSIEDQIMLYHCLPSLAGAEKGPGPASEIGEGAALVPPTEDVPGLQGDIDPHLPPLLDWKKEETKKRKKQKK